MSGTRLCDCNGSSNEGQSRDTRILDEGCKLSITAKMLGQLIPQSVMVISSVAQSVQASEPLFADITAVFASGEAIATGTQCISIPTASARITMRLITRRGTKSTTRPL